VSLASFEFFLNSKMMIIKLDDIKENPENPRMIKDEKFKKLVESIRHFPEMLELRPLVLDENNVVLGGNMRLRALKELGYTETHCIYAKDLTEEQKKEFIIKDNLPYGEWDWDVLANDWDEANLKEWGLDIPDFVDDTEVVDDDFEMPDKIQTDIVTGDLFEIGPHRLLCGDSTSADDVAKVLNGKEPYLMVTDPPYGVDYKPEWRNHIPKRPQKSATGIVENDDQSDWSEAWALSPAKVCYVYHAGKFAGIVQQSLEKNEFEIRSQIIWNKSNFAMSRGDYHWKHEPCWYAVKKGSKGNWAGDRKQTTVWDIAKLQKLETGHSAQKPVECMGRPIKNHDGDVYEPFCGSGTTILAGHQLNRKVYAIEIKPEHVQVTLDRMLKFDPSLKIKKNGIPYKVNEIDIEMTQK
jgi:DNA modification methylase